MYHSIMGTIFLVILVVRPKWTYAELRFSAKWSAQINYFTEFSVSGLTNTINCIRLCVCVCVLQCVSLLLCSTKWCYPLHTLLSQDDLRNLLQSASFSITPSDKPTVTASLELQRGMLQSVFSALLFYGEVWPCVFYAKAIKQHGKDEAKSKGTHTKSAMEYPSSKEPAKDLSKVETIPYNTFIISNTLEYRNRTNPESVAELHLQKVARAIYGSVLLALVHAKPLAQQEEHDPDQIEEGAETSILKDKFLQRQSSCDMLIFPETLSMLVSSIEELLKKAAAYHQLLNETDILAVLSLWHRCNAVLTGRSKPPSTSGEEKSKKRTEHKVVYVVTSETCFYILVDFLLAQTSISPAVWQTALICILGNLRSKCTLEYDQLLELLVKFFLSTSSAVDHGLVQRIMATLLPLSLHSARHEDTLSGACLLLEILVATLQKRFVEREGNDGICLCMCACVCKHNSCSVCSDAYRGGGTLGFPPLEQSFPP